MKPLLRITALCAVSMLAGLGSASAALPPGISGSWYNPAQPGHGLSIDMLSRDRAIISWSAMDLDGDPFNLYIEARIEGERLIGRALAPRGLRFGAWDRNDLEAPDWGEVRIDFSDCNHAVLSWTADGDAGVGFPAGTLPLRRLTALAGVGCDFGLPADPPLPVSTLALRVRPPQENFLFLYDVYTYAAIDPEGRIWGIETGERLLSAPPQVPVRNYVGLLRNLNVVVGRAAAADGGPIELEVRRLPTSMSPLRSVLASGTLRFANGIVSGDALPSPAQGADFFGVSFTSNPPARFADLHPAADRTLDFAGRYRVTLRTQFVDWDARIDVDGDGRICVRTRPVPSDPCYMDGQLRLAFTGQPFVDFTLQYAQGPASTVSGRGWLQVSTIDPAREELVLVGLGAGNNAFGLAAFRE